MGRWGNCARFFAQIAIYFLETFTPRPCQPQGPFYAPTSTQAVRFERSTCSTVERFCPLKNRLNPFVGNHLLDLAHRGRGRGLSASSRRIPLESATRPNC